ncbi:uncharacterized protein SCHCODRAFT_02711546, partial [Schizophyllum commune H4-8]|uniref:uncharacterized protein n=1 Tax=Schizophyllum commune (strain H4-8 / FGSC 9210) TaxID=578458 RepID=UPI002160E63E
VEGRVGGGGGGGGGGLGRGARDARQATARHAAHASCDGLGAQRTDVVTSRRETRLPRCGKSPRRRFSTTAGEGEGEVHGQVSGAIYPRWSQWTSARAARQPYDCRGLARDA